MLAVNKLQGTLDISWGEKKLVVMISQGDEFDGIVLLDAWGNHQIKCWQEKQHTHCFLVFFFHQLLISMMIALLL